MGFDDYGDFPPEDLDGFTWAVCPVHQEEFPVSHGCGSCADEHFLTAARASAPAPAPAPSNP